MGFRRQIVRPPAKIVEVCVKLESQNGTGLMKTGQKLQEKELWVCEIHKSHGWFRCYRWGLDGVGDKNKKIRSVWIKI